MMTRVLQLTNNPGWAGTEAHIAALAAALREQPAIALHGAVFHPGALVPTLEALGVPVRVVAVRFPLDLSAVWRLASLLRRWRIDVLHTHGYKANVIGALAARMAGVRAVVRTEHGLPEPFRGYRRLKMGLYLWLDGLVGRHLTDAMIAVSEDVVAQLRRRFPALPVRRVLNGIGLERVEPVARGEARRALGLPAEGPLVGIVGRLVPVKDHATFLAAAQGIAALEPAAQFLVAGDGPLREALDSRAAALGVAERVHFRHLPGQAQGLLDALDVLVFSSRHEGIPYALLEALRAGVPVVATAVGGLAEVLTHERDALFVPPGEPGDLAVAILRILREPGLGPRLAAEGRRTLSQRLSLERMGEETAAVYRNVLRATGDPARKAALT